MCKLKSKPPCMKQVYAHLLFLFSLTVYGQEECKTTLMLSVGDCRKKDASPVNGADTILVYKLPENTLKYRLIPGQYDTFPIRLDNIPVSAYQLKYKNNYNQLIVRRINLGYRDVNSIELCPDQLESYPQNTLSLLRNNDSIVINVHSSGCFFGVKERLVIIKMEDRFIAKLYFVSRLGTMLIKPAGGTVADNSLINERILDEKTIKDFIRFENELNFEREWRCSSSDTYDIKSKHLNIKITDGSCTWDGFYYLKQSFFDGNK